MATHSSILAWKTPWTEQPGRLQSMGRKESVTTEHAHTHWAKPIGESYLLSASFLDCQLTLEDGHEHCS